MRLAKNDYLYANRIERQLSRGTIGFALQLFFVWFRFEEFPDCTVENGLERKQKWIWELVRKLLQEFG